MADHDGARRVNGAPVTSMSGVRAPHSARLSVDYRQVYAIQGRVAEKLAAWLQTHDDASLETRQELGRQLIAEEVGQLMDGRALRGEPPLPRAAEEALADALAGA